MRNTREKKESTYQKKGYAPKGITNTQKDFIKSLHKDQVIVATGHAGVGKTFIATAYASLFYLQGKCSKIILTRPTVPVGKSIGFFPGSLEEKMTPWVQPFMSVLEDYLTKGKVEMMLKRGEIEIIPFEVIRGRSFDDCYIILDEAQNATIEEVKAFVTRQGKNSTTVINGDVHQTDIKKGPNGLEYLVKVFKNSPRLKEYVTLIEFDVEDIIRSEVCKEWVKAFEKTPP